MKIIKQGDPLKADPKRQATCVHCGAVVEEEDSKLQWEHFPRNESMAREKCPCCGKELFFYR